MPKIHHYRGFSIQRGITERDFCVGKEGSKIDCHFFPTLWEAKEAIDNELIYLPGAEAKESAK